MTPKSNTATIRVMASNILERKRRNIFKDQRRKFVLYRPSLLFLARMQEKDKGQIRTLGLRM